MADYPITLNRARITRLANPERHNGYNVKYTIKAADVAVSTATAATDTVTITLGQTPTNWLVTKALGVVRTPFAGTGALTIQVGATDADFALPATSVLAAGVIQATTGANTVAAPANAKATAAQTLKAVFTNATSGSPSAVTAGEIDVYLSVHDLNAIG